MSDIPPRSLFPNPDDLPPLTPSPVVGVAGFIQTDVVCAACKYNLRGQPREGRCPECGAPVMDAFRRGALTYCDAAWLRRVRSGVVIGFWTFIASIVLGCFASAVVLAVIGVNPQTTTPFSADEQLIFQIVGMIVWAPLVVFGMIVLYRLTAPEPRPNEPGPFERTRTARSVILLAWALLGLNVVTTAISWVINSQDPFAMTATTGLMVYSMSITVLWYLLSFTIFILLSLHLRTIARRDSNPSVGRLFTFLIWGSGVNLLTMAASTVFSFFMIQNFAAISSTTQLTTHSATIQMPGGGPSIQMHQTTTSMPTTMFASSSAMPFTMFHAVVMPIMAIGGCFGLVWFILGIVTIIQFYRALSRAITHNVGMADVFAVMPPPAGADSKLPG